MSDTGIGKKIILVLAAVAVIAAGVILIRKYAVPAGEEPVQGVRRVPEEAKSVSLFFPSKDADGLLSETREIAVGDDLEDQVAGVIAALADGPSGKDMVPVLPEGTEVLDVFWVEETQTLYIDFNRVLQTDYQGGSTSEYYTIYSILRTVASNFPQARRLQLLVDGYPAETLAGHYDVSRPLDIMRWR